MLHPREGRLLFDLADGEFTGFVTYLYKYSDKEESRQEINYK